MTSQRPLSPKQEELLRELEKTGKTPPLPTRQPQLPTEGADQIAYNRAFVEWLEALHRQQEQTVKHLASIHGILTFFLVLVVLGLILQVIVLLL